MEPFVGQISVFGFNFAPLGWAPCLGQIMAIQQNTALFSLIGTYYGGNGTSNFGLPNMQGNVAVGQGQALGGSTYVIGETGGATAVSLTRPQNPTHTHDLRATVLTADKNTAAGNVLARPEAATNPKAIEGKLYNPNTLDTQLNAPISQVGGQPHDNTQPYLALTYCICIRGVFPPRQ